MTNKDKVPTQPDKHLANNRRERLIISEDDTNQHNPHQRTTQARSALYRLIVWFRKESQATSDRRRQAIFDFAADILTGLTRAFRRYEENVEDDYKRNDQNL